MFCYHMVVLVVDLRGIVDKARIRLWNYGHQESCMMKVGMLRQDSRDLVVTTGESAAV